MTKVIFLDRDGTINADHGYTYRIEDWQFTPEAPRALKKLMEAGYQLAIVTNQSGIARGLYTEEDMRRVNEYMREQLAREGVHFAAIVTCSHNRDQDECDCRKPKIGMAKQVEALIGPIDYANSWMIGDKETDAGFGKNAGTKTALIKSKYWQADTLKWEPDMIVDSVWDFATRITKQE